MEVIKFENVSKEYKNGVPVIENLNLSINKGEFITLIGPSGCGKTTMLKLINALIKPDKGNIYIEGKEIKDWDTIELRRSIGYVIQQIGLFPHMNVEDNISYVLDIKKKGKEDKYQRAKELIKLVGLKEGYLKRYPRELSGGQRQRIGVARALAANPDIILMDEPFGAVDEISRRVLQDEILQIYSQLKRTIVFVTHDIEEAFKLGSRIILFNKGKIVQQGTREEMLFNPRDEFVEKFFGFKNFTAYLNVTSVKEITSPISREKEFYYEVNCKKNNIPNIKRNSPLIKGIKILFDYGVDSVGVEDYNGKIIGEFSLKSRVKGNSNY